MTTKEGIGSNAASAATAGAPSLLPCPFCGEPAIMHEHQNPAAGRNSFYVTCNNFRSSAACGAIMPPPVVGRGDRAEAIARWNARAAVEVAVPAAAASGVAPETGA
jgi:Lar family restriction alleviation protein